MNPAPCGPGSFFILIGLYFFFFISKTQAEINIVIVDTGFCPDKIAATSLKSVRILPVVDLTKSVKLDCSSDSFNKESPRFHGQLVLEEFLSHLKLASKESVRLHPLMIYNAKGDQLAQYWLLAMEWIKEHKIDMVLTASGLITSNRLSPSLPGLWFMPSGRVTPQINKQTTLFPQNLAPSKNIYMIGDYFDRPTILYDEGLLYQDKIDYYFPSGDNHFRGTSRAVAEAAAKALSLCPISSMRECLNKKSKVLKDSVNGKLMRTY